jgi:phosphoribosylaminoimidazolecarboxamide formyltransferase/IMP cyclohydrolase
MIEIQRAIISCWDKIGLDDLCNQLVNNDVEIISSGGTAEYLRSIDIPVIQVEELTKSPEILKGRVKTLHPVIHSGILSDRTDEHSQDLQRIGAIPIELVIVNLYPFVEKAIEQNLSLDKAIEFIDIGGPTLLRAASKNYMNVIALHNPAKYHEFLEIFNSNNGKIPLEYSIKSAREVFFYTSYYDGQIQKYFGKYIDEGKSLSPLMNLHLEQSDMLRYGENPHQSGAVYRYSGQEPRGILAMNQLWGKQLSFNNYMDINAAYSLALEFEENAIAIIKHMNPCGAALSEISLGHAFEKALKGDLVSVFGGIVASNRPIDLETARKISEIFFECIIAPQFDSEALELLKKKKNLRLLEINPKSFKIHTLEMKSINGGILIQEIDDINQNPDDWHFVTKKQPDESQFTDLKFLWKICKHIKSNAIVLGKGLQVYGIGAGQMSRVDSVEFSIWKAKKANRDLRGALMASDAFFPFRDGIDRAAEAGISVIIQPGGSIRDEEVIRAADEDGIAMVFTNKRHFRH